MITGMNRERIRWDRRAAYAVSGAVLTGLMVAACSSGSDGSAAQRSSDAAQSQLQQASLSASAARSQSVSASGALCLQWFYSVVPMVNGYNQFVTKLNQVQNYDQLGGADLTAIGQFDSGVTAIRAKLTDVIPEQVRDEVNNFLGKTATLEAAVKDKDRLSLAKPAGEWTGSRHRVSTLCQAFVTPTGAVTTMPSLPPVAELSSAAPTTSVQPVPSGTSFSSAPTTTSAVPTS